MMPRITFLLFVSLQETSSLTKSLIMTGGLLTHFLSCLIVEIKNTGQESYMKNIHDQCGKLWCIIVVVKNRTFIAQKSGSW